jgi:hypothetical protein
VVGALLVETIALGPREGVRDESLSPPAPVRHARAAQFRMRHDGDVDADQVAALREVLASSGWVDRTREFAGRMRGATRHPGGLLLVGTPAEEPWHLAAHLDDESRLSGIPEIAPTLVRWRAPAGAPAHLAITLERLERARRGETVFVVAPDAAPVPLLERVSDARRVGATVLALDSGDDELEALAHDAISLAGADDDAVSTASGLVLPRVSIDTVQHLVSVAAGETPRRRSFRDRLARFIETMSGPAPQRR